MEKGFYFIYEEHEREARRLLLENNVKTEKELSVMSGKEVEEAINREFTSFRAGEDWMHVPNDRFKEYQDIEHWIER